MTQYDLSSRKRPPPVSQSPSRLDILGGGLQRVDLIYTQIN